MKILLVLDNLSVDSGVSSVVMNFYRNMQDVSVDFLIFKQGQSLYIDQIRQNGDQVYVLDRLLSPKTVCRAIRQTKAFFREHAKDYDAVWLHSPTLNEFTLRYAKKYGIPNRVIHSHSSMTSTNPVKKILNQILTRNVTRYANHFWTCSDNAANFLYSEDFVKTHKVEMIYNGIVPEQFAFDLQSRHKMREKLGLQDKTVFCHVSNFSPIKNLCFLIPVMEAVKAQNPNARFLFVGDGPDKDGFEELLRAHDLTDVCLFVGRQTHVLPYWQAADAMLLPSLKEGLPVTVVEAQACGLHCFVTDTITRQCNVGGVTYLPLEQPAWQKALCDFTAPDAQSRKADSAAFAQCAFNIENEAKRVAGLFSDMT